MTLANSLLDKKMAVASILAELGSDSELPRILDAELAEQSCFDHREIPATEVTTSWSSTPSISELLQTRAFDRGADELSSSSYAFRLVVMANIIRKVDCSNNPKYSTILDQLGIGAGEVENYAKDFVK